MTSFFFCRCWSDLDKISQTDAEWHVDCSDMVEIETRCRIPIWQTFGRIQWHVIPEPPATLQGATIWWIHCHDSRATCHIAGCSHLAKSMSWSCHIAGCKDSIRHIENRFSPYFCLLFKCSLGLDERQFSYRLRYTRLYRPKFHHKNENVWADFHTASRRPCLLKVCKLFTVLKWIGRHITPPRRSSVIVAVCLPFVRFSLWALQDYCKSNHQIILRLISVMIGSTNCKNWLTFGGWCSAAGYGFRLTFHFHHRYGIDFIAFLIVTGRFSRHSAKWPTPTN